MTNGKLLCEPQSLTQIRCHCRILVQNDCPWGLENRPSSPSKVKAGHPTRGSFYTVPTCSVGRAVGGEQAAVVTRNKRGQTLPPGPSPPGTVCPLLVRSLRVTPGCFSSTLFSSLHPTPRLPQALLASSQALQQPLNHFPHHRPVISPRCKCGPEALQLQTWTTLPG